MSKQVIAILFISLYLAACAPAATLPVLPTVAPTLESRETSTPIPTPTPTEFPVPV